MKAIPPSRATYRIEAGIPIPPSRGNPQRSAIRGLTHWPFDAMSVGDSFFIETDKDQTFYSSRLLRAANVNGIEITTRRRDENGRKGIRVWRVK